MIDLLNTQIGTVLRNAMMLNEAVAWAELFTYDLKQEILKDWLQQDQLTKRGIDADGSIIGTYSQETEFLSSGRKRAGDNYTLNDQGHFYASMFITVLLNEIEINADFTKMQGQSWWRDQILGLTDENIENLAKITRRKYPEYVRKVLGVN